MTKYMRLDTWVYNIEKVDDDKKNLYNILAYAVRRKRSRYELPTLKAYTFQTEKKIPKILEGYKNTKRKNKDYYPRALITPSPTYTKYENPIPFDGNFALVVGYAKEMPPYVPLDKLIIASDITIYGENGKPQEMYVEGACGLDALNNNLELRSYTINLRKANLEDLLRFIRYSSRNNQSNRNEEMEKIGWYIFIGKGPHISCKQSNVAPRDIKILEIYR